MVNVGIFYDHLEYFMAVWYSLWPFGIVCGHLLYSSQFGMFGPRNIWQPCPAQELRMTWFNFRKSFASEKSSFLKDRKFWIQSMEGS
jgi:hypothetical protein